MRTPCFKCGRRGHATELSPPNSFCCRKCGVWWVNPVDKPEEPESEANGRGCLWAIIILALVVTALGTTMCNY